MWVVIIMFNFYLMYSNEYPPVFWKVAAPNELKTQQDGLQDSEPDQDYQWEEDCDCLIENDFC